MGVGWRRLFGVFLWVEVGFVILGIPCGIAAVFEARLSSPRRRVF